MARQASDGGQVKATAGGIFAGLVCAGMLMAFGAPYWIAAIVLFVTSLKVAHELER